MITFRAGSLSARPKIVRGTFCGVPHGARGEPPPPIAPRPLSRSPPASHCDEASLFGRRQAMITRRGLIGSTLGAAAMTAAGSQPGRPEGARQRMSLDAQIHLWKAESDDWKWVPGAKPQLPEPFTIERALPLMDEAGVDRAVVVPPSWHGDRNDYALEAVKRYPNRFAVMGRIALQDPKSAALLPGWKSQRGMLGIRVTFLGPAATWLTDGTADWFWPEAEKAGLPVMFLAPGSGAQFRSEEHTSDLP